MGRKVTFKAGRATGSAEFRRPGRILQESVERGPETDAAMYRSKAKGRNRIMIFNSE